MPGDDVVTLQTLCGGAVVERFDEALAEVVANILDPNTEAEKKRKITLTVTFEPNTDRDAGTVDVAVKVALQPPQSIGSMLFFGRRAGQAVAVEKNPKQARLFEDDPPAEGARPVALEGGRKD